MTINNRYEFVLLFDITNGNPNGDPDCGGAPRVDTVTNTGIVTDVCIKRKIRNALEILQEGRDGYELYVKKGCELLDQHKKTLNGSEIDYSEIEEDPTVEEKPKKGKGKKKDKEIKKQISEEICKKFIDVRIFGGALSAVSDLAGEAIQGPVQISMAQSIHPIDISRISITRCCISTEKEDKENQGFGCKYIIPYGLYRANGYVSSNCAKKTGLTEEDLTNLFNTIKQMFEFDHSANRVLILRGLLIFKHSSPYGNAPSHKVLDCVKITSSKSVPASFSDYSVVINPLPENVELDPRSLLPETGDNN